MKKDGWHFGIEFVGRPWVRIPGYMHDEYLNGFFIGWLFVGWIR